MFRLKLVLISNITTNTLRFFTVIYMYTYIRNNTEVKHTHIHVHTK